MCHEIWIGAETGARLAHRVTGSAQRAVMRRLFATLAPRRIHTSTAAYAALLTADGFRADILPLFGNIPIVPPPVHPPRDSLRFGFFGQLHPVWPPEPLLSLIARLPHPLELHHIGWIGTGEGVWSDIQVRFANRFTFHRHGPHAPEQISLLLSALDFGIATTPLSLLGKSGAGVAMIEHGVPLIVNRNDVHFAVAKAEPVPEGVILVANRLPDALEKMPRREPHSRLPEIAAQFLHSLSHSP